MSIDLTTATQEQLSEIAATLSPPVVTQYPETDASKAGQRFIYKGNEWHYMTQAEIDSTGWTDLVKVGFPAPVSKVLNFNLFFVDDVKYQGGTPFNFAVRGGSVDTTIDFLGLGLPNRFTNIPTSATGGSANFNLINANLNISEIRNAELLSSLEDLDTTTSLPFLVLNMSANTINSLFTQLPSTEKTVTIDVRSNPGTATCDPSIATAKGYTVITE